MIADRFVVLDGTRAVDLSSGGEEIVWLASTAGGPAEQTRWTLRCGRWSRLYHPAIARLADYGIVGETAPFDWIPLFSQSRRENARSSDSGQTSQVGLPGSCWGGQKSIPAG